MKKVFLFLVGLAVCNGIWAQDPAVEGATITPSVAPLNSTGTFGFTFVNKSATAIQVGVLPTSVTVSFNKVKPVQDNNGNLIVTGAGASYFDWTYIEQDNLIKGTQNKPIPGETIATPASFEINVSIFFTEASTQADATGGNGNGGNINVQTGAGGNLNINNDNASVYGFTQGDALPVAFGYTKAHFTGGALSIEWSTETEVENKAFVIEISKNGEQFIKLDEVSSQAPEGNSSSQLKYSYSKKWQDIVKEFGFSPVQLAIMTVLLLSVLIAAGRRKKMAFFVSVGLLVTVGVGCRKKTDELDGAGKYPATYVRIAQVNKDGTTTDYSKVVKVVDE